jgi:hypothetical protein
MGATGSLPARAAGRSYVRFHTGRQAARGTQGDYDFIPFFYFAGAFFLTVMQDRILMMERNLCQGRACPFS